MKKQIIILILLLSSIAKAQVLRAIVTDYETDLPIHLANVTFLSKDKGTYSNIDGEFELIVNDEKQINISSIGFQNHIIDVSEIKDFNQILVIRLKPSNEKLTEVIITTKKPKYTSSQILGNDKRLKIRTSLPFGYEFATLIKNSKKKKGIVQKVILNLNKSKEFNYLATYNIKFYNYNPLIKQPEGLLHFENVLVYPENRTYKLEIDVSHLNISFPEDGICIGVEIVNDKYDEEINSMSIIAPKINFTLTDLELLTWSRYRNKKWKVRTRKAPFGKKFTNGLIKIKVKYEK